MLAANALIALGTIVLGKERQLKLALACLLARGHLLIEDVPGVGKTTLALALALAGLGAWLRNLFTRRSKRLPTGSPEQVAQSSATAFFDGPEEAAARPPAPPENDPPPGST